MEAKDAQLASLEAQLMERLQFEAELSREFEHVKRLLDQRAAAIQSLTGERDSLILKVQQLEDGRAPDREALVPALLEAERALTILQEDREQSQRTIAALEHENYELRVLREQHPEGGVAVAAMNDAAATIQSLEDSNRRHMKHLEELRCTCEEQARTIIDLQSGQPPTSPMSPEARAKASRDHLQLLETKISELKDAEASLRRAQMEGKNKTPHGQQMDSDEVVALQQRLRELERGRSDLEAQLSSAHAQLSHSRAELDAALTEVRLAYAEASAAEAALEAHGSPRPNDAKDTSRLQSEMATVREQLAETHADLARERQSTADNNVNVQAMLDRERASHAATVQRLEGELQRERATHLVALSEHANNTSTTEVQAMLDRERASHAATVQRLEGELQRERATHLVALSENTNNTSELLATIDRERASHSATVQRLEGELQREREAQKATLSENDEIQRQVRAQDHMIEELRDELALKEQVDASSEGQPMTLDDLPEDLKVKFALLLDEEMRLRALNGKLKKKLKAYVGRVQGLEDERAMLLREREALHEERRSLTLHTSTMSTQSPNNDLEVALTRERRTRMELEAVKASLQPSR